MGRQLAVPEVLGQHSVVEGTLNFRVQFSTAPTTGRLSESWIVPFKDGLPIRNIAAFKGQRNFAGLWWATNQRHVGLESWCEQDQLIRLNVDSEVTGLASQPFRITLPRLLNQCEISAHRGLVVSAGPWASGNTTAIKLSGATHELLTRCKYPTRRDRIPVVYLTTPPKVSPRKLANEFTNFLGLAPRPPAEH